MKTMVAIITCLVLALATVHGQNAKAEKGTLTVVIKGVKVAKGTIRVVLCNSKKGLPEKAKPWRSADIAAATNSVVCAFKDIPFGKYALKYYHDQNNNKKHDRNLLGWPKEPYGLSRVNSQLFSMPKWKNVCFTFDKNKTNIVVKLVGGK